MYRETQQAENWMVSSCHAGEDDMTGTRFHRCDGRSEQLSIKMMDREDGN